MYKKTYRVNGRFRPKLVTIIDRLKLLLRISFDRSNLSRSMRWGESGDLVVIFRFTDDPRYFRYERGRSRLIISGCTGKSA